MPKHLSWKAVSMAGVCALIFQACTPRTFNSRTSAEGTPAEQNPLWKSTLTDSKQFDSFGNPGTGFIKGGRSVKFLIDNRDPASKKLFFLNANHKVGQGNPDYARYHYPFARHVLQIQMSADEFNKKTYYAAENKAFFAGNIQTYTLDKEGQESLAFGVQFFPNDSISASSIVEAVSMVTSALKFQAKIVFIATGPQQSSPGLAEKLLPLNVESLSIDKVLAGLSYVPMNEGEAWGYLRIFPKNLQELQAFDIPVFESLPLDLAVVAGTITRDFQDTNSHINLKSKERNTPNMVLRGAGPDSSQLKGLDNAPVHLVVGDEGFRIEPTTENVIRKKMQERLDKPWVPVKWESTRTLLSYDDMCLELPAACLGLSSRYGSKAANLGFLAHRSVLGRTTDLNSPSATLGYNISPRGFGVPLQFYWDFVEYAPNTELRAKLKELIALEKSGKVQPSQRVTLLAAIRNAFYKARMPPESIKVIKEKVSSVLPGVEKIKVRSSANAEDIREFNGAGLYDSFSAKPNKAEPQNEECRFESDTPSELSGGTQDVKGDMKPGTIGCAIKGVYASIWNKRAVEERNNARLDHESVSMGLSILPVYDTDAEVTANSVVITRVINATDLFGYTVSVQKGNNTVTNPDPGTISETTIATYLGEQEPLALTVLRYAKPTPQSAFLTEPVLKREEMLTLFRLSKAVETAYCKANRGYYNGDCGFVAVDNQKNKALDMEFKLLANGHFSCKQVREFSGH